MVPRRQVEPSYRSRGEAQIGRALDQYGISFEHEQPTLIYSRGQWRTWRPDFTLPERHNLIVEYAGMPDVLSYRQGIDLKEITYAANKRPALFVFPGDLVGPDWSDRLMRRIEHLEQVLDHSPVELPDSGIEREARRY